MKDTWKEWGKAGIEAFIILLLLFVFLWPVHVDGISMEKTMSDGDGVLMSRFFAWTSRYETGDILVFRYHEGNRTFPVVKRVIAVGGDTIKIKNGDVFVNEEKLKEEYIQGDTKGDMYLSVPSGQVFLMGDNREESYDSRYMGAISKKQIIGKVLFRWFPVSKIGKF